MTIIIIIAVFVFVELYVSKYSLQVSTYTISSEKIIDQLRIVQLSDLHNSVFGRDNQKLVNLVQEQSPDLILITGDLLNSDESETDTATGLISSLCNIAPVYVSMGNHEEEYQQYYGTDIIELYEKAGAIVLEKQYEDITVNGQQIRLGGIYGYCLPYEYLETNEADPEECYFLLDFQDTDRYTILMCHMPVSWLIYGSLDSWEVDCVMAGHAHGGQIRIPFVGGLWAPDQGWFPGEECGLYYSSDGSKVTVLSRGLGSTEIVPRFNNIPEIVVLDLLPES